MPTISQLASDTVPNDNDLLVTVDVAAGTTKNITREDFFTGAPLPAGSVDEQALTDSGWVSVPATSGYTSALQVRKLGGVIYIRGAITKATDFGTGWEDVATIPVGFRPPAYTEATIARNHVMRISGAGVIGVMRGAGSAVNQLYLGFVSYPAS